MSALYSTISFFVAELNRKEQLLIILSVSLALIGSTLLSISPYLLSGIADRISEKNHYSDIWTLSNILAAAAFLIFVGSQRLIGNLTVYITALIRVGSIKYLSESYFRYLSFKNNSFYSKKNVGNIAQYLNQVNNEFYTILRSTVSEILAPIFQLTVSIGIIFYSGHYFVSICFAAYSIAFVLNTYVFSKKLVEEKLDMMEAGRSSYEILIDSVSNISVAQQNNSVGFLSYRLNRVLDVDMQLQKAYWRTNFIMLTNSTILYLILFGATFAYAFSSAAAGEVSVGQFVMIATYVVMLTTPVERLGEMGANLSQAISAFGKFLDEIHKTTSSKNTAMVHFDNGALPFEINELHFEYDGAEKAGLHSISTTFTDHSKVNIIGQSGSGKSTFLKILAGLEKATHGTVKLFGVDLANVTPNEVFRYVGYIGQDTYLFKDTLRFNLLIANPNASDSELRRSLDLACLDDYLISLPNGLDTLIGDRGTTISGGQKQRIAFARLFLRRPSVILLDEATSALDIKTESRLLDNLFFEFPNTTIVSVSHRPSMFSRFDRCIQLEGGYLVGDHTSKDLSS